MRTDTCSPIPRLIHQTWKTRDVPPEFQALQRSWIDRNPGFEYRFWTDEDIGRFIAEEHPALLPVFHGYADPIARIDLARYLILRRFGGVYADLDFECLRPIDGLLEGRSFVVGLEPEEHGRLAKAVERGLPRILCPSFLASVPGHPFWDHLLDRLVEARSSADVLDATGPFLLTRAHAAYEGARHGDGAAAVTVLPPELLYPVTKEDCWSGRLFDPVFWERATRRAYGVHYWEGTWFRDAAGRGAGPEATLPRQIAAVVTDGRPEGARSPLATAEGAKAEGLPLISCLMVTRGRRALLEFAIDGFARQTYPNRELVIVCDSPALPQDDPLERAVRAAGCRNVRLIRVNAAGRDGGLTLGELRNIAVDHAAGRYVCQWDDDDLYDPCRLQMQQRVLAAAGAQACLLGRWMIWWPAEDRLAVSCERDWEGSLLCEKAVMPRYPALRRGEDTPVVEQLRRSARVVRMDLPRLYTYVVHGGNTFTAAHFEEHWKATAARFSGDRCRAMLEEMGKRLPVEAYRREVMPVPAMVAARRETTLHETTRREKVLVLTPVKDAVAHLPRYLELLGRLDHDPSRLSLGFLEGDSGDGTHGWLADRLPELRQRYRRVALLRHDYGFRPEGPRWAPDVQRRRRELLARSRNRLLSGALGDEDWVLWLDADLVDYPPDLLARLLATGRDIVVPHCVLPDGRTFDLNSFRLSGEEDPRHLADGIFQPPRGVGRLYLDAFAGKGIVPLDGVGGTALLVRADLHREGLCFPPYSHRGYIETEGLAAMAKDMGVASWGLPDLRIVHANH
ncbi:glycosyltransferase [Azospirillum sp. Sh1]|uniref:glycosyltransferase n=1 Tax=Azospirillum sp. Sh1 TaxID=2607285 RepID=UPI0011EBF2EE|nr:glycosyltransferase [Azospirillum sp. Sh1]KAA0579339.1 glycosyltransferase [Azospirillum sp. Sh1]